MESLSTNIFVMAHPQYTPLEWSHHQKLVIVDQDIAFVGTLRPFGSFFECGVGGLDLCFGRYDSQNHKLNDEGAKTWLGKDYYNPFLHEMGDVEHYQVESGTLHDTDEWVRLGGFNWSHKTSKNALAWYVQFISVCLDTKPIECLLRCAPANQRTKCSWRRLQLYWEMVGPVHLTMPIWFKESP